MTEDEVLAYVKLAAAVVDLPLDEARAQAVALHLGRTVAIARALEQAPLAPHDELAEIYCPAPFPAPEDAA
jgi:hypothetical protein